MGETLPQISMIWETDVLSIKMLIMATANKTLNAGISLSREKKFFFDILPFSR